MFEIKMLTKRNIKIFLRDRTAVFFSFLSVIILLSLYFLFINNTYMDSLKELPISDAQKSFLTLNQMMGGVLVINTFSLSLGMMGNMVNDLYFKKIDSFLVTPTERYKITLSYYIAAIIVTYVLSMIMWILTIIYIVAVTGYLYSFSTIIIVSLLLFLYTIVSTSIMLFLISFIKSVNAFGAIAGIFGTLIGFTSGIYMPLAILPKTMTYVSSFIPFTHMTILLKQQLLNKPISLIENAISIEAIETLKMVYGINEIGVIGFKVDMIIIMFGIIFISILFFLATIKRLSKKNK